ncbi:MAG: chemotaxis protein CheW [Gallionella sp.]|nr:chemotaxis protein CheW [Gallionella sp.]
MRADIDEVLSGNCQVLVLKMGGMLACIELGYVERTISLVALHVMPGSAPHVAGIMNYAGSSVPVIDLAIRLGLPSLPYTLDTPIVVCMHGLKRMGVIVQDIKGIQMLQESDLQLTGELGRHDAAFRACAHTDTGLAFLLDAAWLINSGLYQGAEQ